MMRQTVGNGDEKIPEFKKLDVEQVLSKFSDYTSGRFYKEFSELVRDMMNKSSVFLKDQNLPKLVVQLLSQKPEPDFPLVDARSGLVFAPESISHKFLCSMLYALYHDMTEDEFQKLTRSATNPYIDEKMGYYWTSSFSMWQGSLDYAPDTADSRAWSAAAKEIERLQLAARADE